MRKSYARGWVIVYGSNSFSISSQSKNSVCSSFAFYVNYWTSFGKPAVVLLNQFTERILINIYYIKTCFRKLQILQQKIDWRYFNFELLLRIDLDDPFLIKYPNLVFSQTFVALKVGIRSCTIDTLDLNLT